MSQGKPCSGGTGILVRGVRQETCHQAHRLFQRDRGGDQRVAAEDRAGEEGGEGLPTSGRPVKGAVEDGKDRRTDPNSQTCGDVERAFLAGE